MAPRISTDGERKRGTDKKTFVPFPQPLKALLTLHSSSLIISQYFFSTVARCPPLTGGVMQESVLLPVAFLYGDFVVLLVHMDPACSHDPRCFLKDVHWEYTRCLNIFQCFLIFHSGKVAQFFVTACGYLFLMHRQFIMGFSF